MLRNEIGKIALPIPSPFDPSRRTYSNPEQMPRAPPKEAPVSRLSKRHLAVNS